MVFDLHRTRKQRSIDELQCRTEFFEILLSSTRGRNVFFVLRVTWLMDTKDLNSDRILSYRILIEWEERKSSWKRPTLREWGRNLIEIKKEALTNKKIYFKSYRMCDLWLWKSDQLIVIIAKSSSKDLFSNENKSRQWNYFSVEADQSFLDRFSIRKIGNTFFTINRFQKRILNPNVANCRSF